MDVDRSRAIRSHRDLLIWQKSMDLVIRVYAIAKSFPETEKYRLTAQITTAVVSVPSNIAEGNAQGTRKAYANFLSVAKGSLMETETLLMIAERLGYLRAPEMAESLVLVTELSKMMTALRSKLTR